MRDWAGVKRYDMAVCLGLDGRGNPLSFKLSRDNVDGILFWYLAAGFFFFLEGDLDHLYVGKQRFSFYLFGDAAA